MMKLPVILPVKLVYLGTSKNSNLGHVIHGKPQASPENKGAERFFYKEEGGVGRGCCKQRVHWNPGNWKCVVALIS